ncbi:MAG: CBS domain-containing protein [Actinobacteria bacterium]|nr:CBS domain-containing protein [Actinomycetota bacterium]
MNSTIEQVMTTDVVSCSKTATVADAARLMRDRNIGDVLVTDNSGKLAGIVTDRDMVVRCLADGADPNVTLGEVCTTDLATLTRDASIDEAVRMMSERSMRRVPVVDRGKPIGIVSLGDLAIERDPQSALGEISAAAPTH